MDRKQLALVAASCGVVTVIGVLLPWWSSSVTGDMPAGLRADAKQLEVSYNGTQEVPTQGSFKGTWALVLAIIAAAAAMLVYLGRTDLLRWEPRQHLMLSVLLFAVAAILTATDAFRSIPGGRETVRGMAAQKAGGSAAAPAIP